MYGLIEEKIGPRMARGVLWAVALTPIVAVAIGLGTIAYYFNENVIKVVLPKLPGAPDISAPPGYPGVAVVSLLVTGALTSGALYLVFRRLKVSERVLSAAVESYVGSKFHTLTDRVSQLESGAASVGGVVENVEWLRNEMQALAYKVSAIESERESESLVREVTKRMVERYLTIHLARYGSGVRWKDVTDRVRSWIRDNKIDGVKVENDVLGSDPTPGTHKSLIVLYSVGSNPERFQLEFSEHDTVRIPKP